MPDWQPLIDAAGSILAFWLWPWLIALWFFAAIIERYPTLAHWFEALGWDGLRELLAGFGNSPSALMKIRNEVEVPPADNVSKLSRS